MVMFEILFRKCSFQNYYKQHSKYKNYIIDIGHIELLNVASNPLNWSPLYVYKYLSNDPNCKQVGKKLFSLVNNVNC